MRVLVTGASGFVGGAVAAELAGAGHEVVGLSRRPGPAAGVTGLLTANLADPAVAERVRGEVEPCQAVVHAAAALGGSGPRREAMLVATNCLGTQQMIALAEAWSCRRFVYVSSLPVIGPPRELPITESHPTAPPTAYHATKLFGEHLVGVARPTGAAILRLASPVGPGMPARPILAAFVSRALAGEPLEVAGRGTRRQDYVDVRDVARAVAAALTSDADGVFNVASGRAVSNCDLARLCVEVVESDSEVVVSGEPHPDDEVAWDVSIERARRELGWRPTYPLRESVTAVACTIKRSPRRDELRKKSG